MIVPLSVKIANLQHSSIFRRDNSMTATTTATGTAPLAGIRVLDMSRILAGPWAGQTLADLGATVIKIERPGLGDDTRRWGPPYLADSNGDATAEAAYYLACNRGKQSLTVDITQPEGQEIIRKLALESDVVLENYKVGGLKKYRLDAPSLRALNPKLIYCSITGFGQTGPYAHRAGYDFLIQAMGGLMSITGQPEAEGGEPTKVGVAVTDLFTGLYAVIAIQAALIRRQQCGTGEHIDLSLLETSTAILANQATNYLVGGVVPGLLGNAHPNIVPYQAFATADGHMILAVGNDGQFRAFCEIADNPEWADDPRFASNAQRVAHRVELCAAIAEVLKTRTTQHWLEQLETRSVPCGPINRIDQVFANEHLLQRGMLQPAPHPQQPDLKLPRNPIHFAEAKMNQNSPPPLLGEHSDALLKKMGYSDQEIAHLRETGVV